MEMIYSIDLAIMHWVQDVMHNGFLDAVMAALSFIGNHGLIWIIIGIVLVIFKKTRYAGIVMLSALAFGFLMGEGILKHLVNRPRPFVDYPEFVPGISLPSGSSFPSGHSCAGFACSTVMMVKNRKIGIPMLVLAVLIAFSRIYNFVHFPSDVLCGMLLGVLSAVLILFIYSKTKLEAKLSGVSKQ